MNNFDLLMASLTNYARAMAEPPKSLKIMELPGRVFNKVIRLMDFIDVFELSLLSKRMSTRIMLVDIQIDCLEIICEDNKNKIMFRNHWKEPVITFDFGLKSRDIGCEMKMLGNYKLFVIHKKRDRREYHCRSENFEEDLKKILDFFCKIFRFRSGFAAITLRKEASKLREIIDHPIFNDRLCLKLSGKLRRGYRGLESLLHKYHHLEGIYVNFNFDQRLFNWRDVMALPRVCFMNATWMTRDHLLSIEFQRLKLNTHRLDCEDLNAFIKHWMAGTSRRLCRLELGSEYKKKEWTVAKVLEGLDAMPWIEGRRHPDYVMDHIQSPYTVDTRLGLDIERKDGLLATILLKETSFMFLVWHRRFNGRVGAYPMRSLKLVNNL